MRNWCCLGMMMWAFGMTACGKNPDPNTNPNTTNNNTILPDMDLPDIAIDMPEDMANPFVCTSVGWAPYTIPASEGGQVTFEIGCTGGEGDVESELSYTLTRPDGSTLEGTVPVTLTRGTFEVNIPMPPQDFVAGPISARFNSERDKSDASWFEWGTETKRPEMRLHMTNNGVAQLWADRVGFELAPPAPDAKMLRYSMGDFTGTGKLDVLVLWRYGTKLGVQRYVGEAFTPGEVHEVELGLSTAETTAETVRLVRVKGETGSAKQAIVWVGHDDAQKDVSIAITPYLGGSAGNTTRFTTLGTSHAKVDAILGVEVVDSATLMMGDAPEVFVFYRGTTGGVKPAFATLVTDTANQKLLQASVMDSLNGIVPANVASNDVHVGLMRGVSGSADKRFLHKAESLSAWTFGNTGLGGEHELRRVNLNGGSLSASVIVPDVMIGEAGFAVEAVNLDGDAYNDLVLSSVDNVLSPVIRTLKLDGEGTFGTQGRLLPPHTQIRVQATTHFIDDWQGESMYMGSPSHPHSVRTAKATGSMAEYFVSGIFTTQIGTGDPVPVEVAWAANQEQPAYLQPITLGSVADFAAFDPDVHALASSFLGKQLSFSVRKTNDKALIASHENGLSLLLKTGGEIEVAGPLAAGKTFRTQDGGKIVGIVSNTAKDQSVVLDQKRDGDLWNFHVWSIASGGVTGPGVIRIPAALGDFLPASPTAENVIFGSTENGEYKTFEMTLAQLGNLAKDTETMTVSEGMVQKRLGESVQIPTNMLALKRQIANGGANERARKAQIQKEIALGVTPPLSGTESMAVVGKQGGVCPLQTVYLAGESGDTPVVISESTQEDCWDLHVPVMAADICGVGGVQLVTAAANTTARSAWTWEFLLWTRNMDSVVATSLGTVQSPPMVRPTVTASDINGDGVVDLLVRVENTVMAPGEWSDAVLFGDGLAGALDYSTEIPNFTSEIRTIPGSGLGQGAGQVACGMGLQCNLGTGTRTSSSQAGTKAELL